VIEDRALDETIKNDVQHIARLFSMFCLQKRMTIRQPLDQGLQTEIFQLDRRIAKALNTFFDLLTFDAQVEGLNQHAEKIRRR
jgi:hypothetical protein